MTEWLSEVKRAVEARLSSFFEAERARVRDLAPEGDVLLAPIEALTMRGGKRLRPAVLFAAYRAVHERGHVADVVDACASLELLQSYLLIHDDWMDGDDERRGGPSAHALLRRTHRPDHLADSLAILAGDYASAQSWRLLESASPDPVRRSEAMQVMLRMHEEVIVGQTLDLLAVPDVTRMQQLKTGSYTLRGPLALGAVLGGATESQREALDRFGVPLGEAFQMRDDLLGTFGDPKITGKPAGNDLKNGKRTALVRAAFELLDEGSRAPLTRVLGNAHASDRDLDSAIELLVSCGARQAVEQRLGALAEDAQASLRTATLSEHGRALLLDIARLLTERTL